MKKCTNKTDRSKLAFCLAKSANPKRGQTLKRLTSLIIVVPAAGLPHRPLNLGEGNLHECAFSDLALYCEFGT